MRQVGPLPVAVLLSGNLLVRSLHLSVPSDGLSKTFRTSIKSLIFQKQSVTEMLRIKRWYDFCIGLVYLMHILRSVRTNVANAASKWIAMSSCPRSLRQRVSGGTGEVSCFLLRSRSRLAKNTSRPPATRTYQPQCRAHKSVRYMDVSRPSRCSMSMSASKAGLVKAARSDRSEGHTFPCSGGSCTARSAVPPQHTWERQREEDKIRLSGFGTSAESARPNSGSTICSPWSSGN